MSDEPPRGMDRYPMVLVADRQYGKSTQAFRWLAQGKQTSHYPGWSRVLIVSNLQMLEYHKHEWWGTISDYSHRVYALEEIRTSRMTAWDPQIEVCLDDLDILLKSGMRLSEIPGRVTAITMTGRQWEEQPYPVPASERPHMV